MTVRYNSSLFIWGREYCCGVVGGTQERTKKVGKTQAVSQGKISEKGVFRHPLEIPTLQPPQAHAPFRVRKVSKSICR